MTIKGRWLFSRDDYYLGFDNTPLELVSRFAKEIAKLRALFGELTGHTLCWDVLIVSFGDIGKNMLSCTGNSIQTVEYTRSFPVLPLARYVDREKQRVWD